MTKLALIGDHTIFPDTLRDLVSDLTGFRILCNVQIARGNSIIRMESGYQLQDSTQ
jgi:hypothetical protein